MLETARKGITLVARDQSLPSRHHEHQEPQQAGVLVRDSRRLPDRAEVDRLLRDRHRADRPEYMHSPDRRQRQLQMLSGVRFPYLILTFMP